MSTDASRPDRWSVYLVRTRLGTLYTGIATDVVRRLGEHAGGRGAKYLRARGPLTLAYSVSVGTRGSALRLEAAIKRLPRVSKENIVQVQPGLVTLARLAGRPDLATPAPSPSAAILAPAIPVQCPPATPD